MFLIIFSPSPTETLNHVSAFPAIYTDMIHTGAVSCLQPKPTNLPRMLAFYFLPSPSLGTSELGVSAPPGNSSMSDGIRKEFLSSTVGVSHGCLFRLGLGWSRSSGIERVPSLCVDLGSIPSTEIRGLEVKLCHSC